MGIIVESDPAATMLRGHRDNNLFLQAALPSHPDLVGTFGISSPGLLTGLLSQFDGEGADVTVQRHRPSGQMQDVVSAFHLTSRRGTAIYRTTSAQLMPVPLMRDVGYTIDVEPEHGAVDEFVRLARLLPDDTIHVAADGEQLRQPVGLHVEHHVTFRTSDAKRRGGSACAWDWSRFASRNSRHSERT